MAQPQYTTALELLDRMEEAYRRHLAIRDRKVLEGNPRTIRTLEQYQAYEMGMRAVIWDARMALGLPADEWAEKD